MEEMILRVKLLAWSRKIDLSTIKRHRFRVKEDDAARSIGGNGIGDSKVGDAAVGLALRGEVAHLSSMA